MTSRKINFFPLLILGLLLYLSGQVEANNGTVCDPYEDCTTCVSETNCGWCETGRYCFYSSGGNSLSIQVPNGCNEWYWGQCDVNGNAWGTNQTYTIMLVILIIILCGFLAFVIIFLICFCQKDENSSVTPLKEIN